MKVGIALGSNLGNRAAQMRAAGGFIRSLHEGGQVPLCSGLYETDPVDCASGTTPFLNAVVEIESSLDPQNLLQRLRDFEQASGRAAIRAKNNPRNIDLDLLYAGDARLATSALTLPHPRLTTRRFVLQPLADIRPNLILPGESDSIASLLARLPVAPAVRRIADQW